MSNTDRRTKRLGRPLGFDRGEALDAAVEVFWARGFDGTSMGDLTKAMGISRPSLYSAYQNKHALFLACLERYSETHGRSRAKPLVTEAHFKDAVGGYLRGIVVAACSEETPKGCLISCVATEMAERDEAVREKLSAMRTIAEGRISARIQEAQAQGQLPEDADPRSLARAVLFVGQGLAVQARRGASEQELLETTDTLLRALI